MFLHRIKHKKILASIILGTALTQAQAEGIPVLDLGSLKQSIENYQQLIKSYQEQLKQGANQIKQMAEQGIGMQINDILGQTQSIIDNTLQNLNFQLPTDLFQETADVTNACSFLEQESPEFAQGIEQAGKKLSDKVSTCLNTVTDTAINQTLDKLKDQEQQLMQGIKEAPDKLQEALNVKAKIQNIEQAAQWVKTQALKDSTNKIQLMLDTYENGNAKNPYSKQKMDNDIQKLATELKDPKNEKQAQALTNAMLLKLLETSQKNYEASLAFYKMQSDNLKTKESTLKNNYQAQAVKAIDANSLKEVKEAEGQGVIYNDAGFPDFEAMMKRAK